MVANIFSAEEPSLGYLYQIVYSLMLLLQSSEIEDAKVSIEKLDDIQIDEPDQTRIYQTKYHLNSAANLTDRSSDLWKTLRVWCTGISDGTIDVKSFAFHLITTAAAGNNSIVQEFKKPAKERDIAKIISTLDVIAGETTNQVNRDGYKAFSSLSEDNKKVLISRIHLFDSSIDINTVKQKVFAELRKTVIDDKVPSLYERLIGWYLLRAVENLLGETQYISFKELQQKNFEIIECLKIDNLPADFPDPVEFSEDEIKDFKQRKFVKQLHVIGMKDNSVKSAISDYHRAYEQRSRWLRESLIDPQDEIKYEAKLYDDWKRKFDALVEGVDITDPDIKTSFGKNFYLDFYVKTYPKIYIRDKFDHTYMITGSCHILSDGLKIGWHPDFEKIVEK